MPENAAAAPQANQQQNQPAWSSFIFRMLLMYMAYSYFMKGKSSVPTKDASGKSLPPFSNKWPEHQKLVGTGSECVSHTGFSDALLWRAEGLTYDWEPSSSQETKMTFPTPPVLLNNGSLWAHVALRPSGGGPLYRSHPLGITGSHPLTRHKISTPPPLRHLLEEPTEEPKAPPLPSPHWKESLTLHLVLDHTVFPRGGIPPQIESHLSLDSEKGTYLPVLFFNDFWLRSDELVPVNETVPELNLTISFSPLSLMKWQLFSQMDESFRLQQSMGTSGESEAEEFKRMLVETNPYLLALTAVVTILHSVFDILAFKNDITFWKNRKSVEGISVRTLVLNLVCQAIIFLYLLDNETSWVILISAGIGILIEVWKVGKAVDIEWDSSKWIPLRLRDKPSYAARTRELDATAFKYLSWVSVPLLIGWAAYSLVNRPQKSWYSWVLGVLTSGVYTFGFLMMTPQLFINYKLKSVAHLPWKAFMYKALNTFIDDLFAFIIKMPTLHRLSCFRDDIVFLIYLYQRWIYRVDYSRVNEFGQGGEDVSEKGPETQSESTSEETSEQLSEAEKKEQ